MCIAMYFSDVAPSDVWVVVTKGTKERSLIYLERSDFNKLFTQWDRNGRCHVSNWAIEALQLSFLNLANLVSDNIVKNLLNH